MARPVSKSYISELTNLKIWFEAQGNPYFKVYHGHGTMKNVSHENIVEQDMDLAFDSISSFLKMNGVAGGQFTVNVFPDPIAYNKGLKRIYFQWPMAEGQTSINAPAQQVGIGGSEVQLMLKVQQLEWENRLLQDQLDNSGGDDFKSMAMEMARENAPQLIGVFGPMLANIIGPRGLAAINGIGSKISTPITQEEDAEGDQDESEVPELTPEEIESFGNSITVLKTHFGVEATAIFAKLAAFVSKDPEAAMVLLKTYLR